MNKNIFILTGSNLGDRLNYLSQCGVQIENLLGEIKNRSSIYETAAWGKIDQPNFLNQVLQIESNLNPQELLTGCLNIEGEMGRLRTGKWEARTIDIDILYFDQEIIQLKELTIPHPRLHERKFVLVPLVEISPAFVHPVLKKTNLQLLNECTDVLAVNLFKD